MTYLGTWEIDDVLTFTVTTHTFATGALTDADSVPSYRVYEDETGTAILNGSMAKLDDTNTTGHYSEQITLSAANGFEVGKTYSIYITAAVASVTGGTVRSFQVEAAPATAAALQVVDDLVDDLESRLTSTRAGYLDNLSAGAVATASALATVDGIVDDILVDTGTTLPGTLTTIAGYVDTEVASVLAAVDTEVAAIKAKTDNLPSDPADDSDIDAQLAAIAGYLDTEIAAIKAKTDNLPTDPADQSAVEAAITAAVVSAAAVADAVWDEALAGHASAGSAGAALSTASAGGVDTGVLADAIWDEALSGHATAGTTGKKLTDLVNADLSGLATAAAVDDLPTNAELATALGMADDAVLAAISALNNLSSAGAQAAAAAALAAYNASTLTAAQVNAEVVDVLRTDTIPDSYAADGAQPTFAQAALMILQFLSERSVSGTTVTVKKPDGSTTAMTFTLSDATNPASITRS